MEETIKIKNDVKNEIIKKTDTEGNVSYFDPESGGEVDFIQYKFVEYIFEATKNISDFSYLLKELSDGLEHVFGLISDDFNRKMDVLCESLESKLGEIVVDVLDSERWGYEKGQIINARLSNHK
jgi:hypothetical protein